MRGRACLVAAVLFAAAPLTAFAEEPSPPEVIPPKARALAAQGRKFHDAGEYDKAIAAFKEAYVMAPSPSLLFNIAQAYRLSGNCDDSALMYHRYLDTGPSPEGRAIAEAHLEKVERCAHKTALHIPQDPGTMVAVAPPSSQASQASAGLTVELTATSASRRASVEKDVGIGVTIGGAAAMSVAMYYAFKAHDASAAVEDAYAKGAKWQDVQPIDDRGQHSATLAQVFGIGGGIAVATGVTLYVLGKRAEHAVPVAVMPTKHGAEVALAWQF